MTAATTTAFPEMGVRRARVRWRRIIVRGCLLLIVVGVAATAYYWWAANNDRHLRTVIADLDRVDPGWRWDDIQAARRSIAEAENSAPHVVAAGKKIPPEWLQDPAYIVELLAVPS